MSLYYCRLKGREILSPLLLLCDACSVEGQRFGDELPGLDAKNIIGCWPSELDTQAMEKLVQEVGEHPVWHTLATIKPVAKNLTDKAQLQDFDKEVISNIKYLQNVCHQPRLNLLIEEERIPVSRAKRTPMRAVADLVSHPGDWEHRTLRSIQPIRVLARQIEDDWNLYENRVAVRLVDHLLLYLSKRLDELYRIKKAHDIIGELDYDSLCGKSSHWRTDRILKMAETAFPLNNDDLEKLLKNAVRLVECTQRDLQALFDTTLYKKIPKLQSVPLSLKPTNILINDRSYKKVASLWKKWLQHGYKRQETNQQRLERRQREAVTWDRFVLHLVVRAFSELKWSADVKESGWRISRAGWLQVDLEVGNAGVVRLRAGTALLNILPLCVDLSSADKQQLSQQLETWDSLDGEVVVAHVGETLNLDDVDRASGWSFCHRTVLFGCSPWEIDSEERMTRLINGWLNRLAVRPYPFSRNIKALPGVPLDWEWLRYEAFYLVAYRMPDDRELALATNWASNQKKDLTIKAQRATQAKQAFEVAPVEAVTKFQEVLGEISIDLEGLDQCPVCPSKGNIEPRPGEKTDGSDSTWWATCNGCKSEWGLRRCTTCGERYRVLTIKEKGENIILSAPSIQTKDWPDKILGRDVWAQPCNADGAGQYRCPNCGKCGKNGCVT